MMTYYRDPDGNVYGYDPADQADLIAQAQNKGWEDVSDSWPPTLPEQVVPEAITPRQARLALLGAGLLDKVEAAIAGMDGQEGQAARIMWEYATEVRRDDPLLVTLTAALGLDDEQVDALFLAGAVL